MGEGVSTIKINLAGTQFQNLGNQLIKGSSKSNIVQSSQQKVIALDKSYKLTATLTLESAHLDRQEIEKRSATGLKAKSLSVQGSTQSNLPNGTKYRILLYDATGDFVEYKDYEVGAPLTSNDSFRVIPGQDYTFVGYSVGGTDSNELNDIMPTGSFSNAMFKDVNGNGHFMYYIKPASSYQDGLTTLDIILRHQFSQVKTIVQLDDAVSGELDFIEATIVPHLNKVNVSVRNGVPDFDNGSMSNGAVVNFTNASNKRSAEATTIITASDQTSNGGGILAISSIRIDGKTNSQVPPVEGLKIIPGGRYTLTLNVTKFTPDEPVGIELGGRIWATGNLVYDRSTEVYSFAAAGEHGDYWFQNYWRPKRLDISNPNPTDPHNGPREQRADPCSKVLPLGTWRLPNENDFKAIASPNSTTLPFDRYVGNYNGAGTNIGMFINTAADPGEDRADYLFFPFAGYYANSSSNTGMNVSGHFLERGTSILPYRERLFYTNKNVEPNDSPEFFTAFSIRCVQMQ